MDGARRGKVRRQRKSYACIAEFTEFTEKAMPALNEEWTVRGFLGAGVAVKTYVLV